MNFRTETTLAGYARAAVTLKTRMDAYCRSSGGQHYLTTFAHAFHDNALPDQPVTPDVIDVVRRLAGTAWRVGEPYVLAPAMTAIVAAAADALDLSGEILHDEVAPGDFGVLFLPDPIYTRNPRGQVTGIAAITWARLSTPGGSSAWAIAGWSALDDPDDPETARLNATLRRQPKVRRYLGPYLLADIDYLPVNEPVPAHDTSTADEADLDWEPAPDGRYVIDTTACRTSVCTAIIYAFWRIQAQPLATVAPAPLDRPAARRAARASVVHDTRVVMLRRTSPVAEPANGEAKWHYRVRFIVRGHWRRLTDKQGRPYRIWIHAFIKGPDGAPLLAGEKVAILAR